ncbi:MAG: CBM96 family carbohydrate-binding protein [Acidimicrobiia bacterium]
MRSTARRALAVLATVAIGITALPAQPATAGIDAGIPSLSLNRAYTTAPFPGTTTTANSQEGSAYVPADNALWLVDTTHAYEVDASTDQLRRTVATADFTNALPIGGVGTPAGTTRSDSFAAIAYDPTADALYVFSRNCCTTTGLDPSVFRLLRDGSGVFQVESYQSLPAGTDPKGAGYRAGVGLYFGKGAKIKTYDYSSNTLGADITIPGIDAAIQGMTFSEDGAHLYAVTFVAGVSPDPNSVKLYRIATSTWTVEPNWTLDLAPFGVLDPRAVEVVGQQIYVADGGTRAAGDPLRRAVFVFDVNDLAVQPVASFSATPVTGQYPLPVQFTDATTGGPTSWSWDFGDGTTSNLANPSHTYAAAGSYTVSLTVSNSKGSDTSTQTNLVTVTDQTPLAGFTATPTSGQYPLSVSFTDTSVKHPTSWAWDFGDGATSTQQSPSHTYTAPGDYAVSLTVTNGSGTNTRVRSDFIHATAAPVTVTAAADTYVRSDQATTNFGTQTTLQGQVAAAVFQPFVRFTVPALPETPASATLRLFVTDASASTGNLFATGSTSWSETAVTWNNRPTTTGGQIAPAQAATLGQWVEFDVSSLVKTSGAYSFTLTGASADAVAFSSRQGANAPQLVVSFPQPTVQSLPNPPHVGLRLNHEFTTSPFRGTTVAARDEEGSAYVPSDNALWLIDDNFGRMYEVDGTTNDFRRVITTADFLAAPQVGTGALPGPTRVDDLESLNYDPGTDTLYATSGNCCGTAPFDPTIYRLQRDAQGKFQVKDWQALPEGTDPTGSGWRNGPNGGMFFVKGQNITPYDWNTNTVGTPTAINGVDVGLVGATFTPDGHDLLVTSHLNRLYRVDPDTWTVRPGWSFDLSAYGIIDPRAVEIIGDQLFVSDGYDFRAQGDPLRYGIFVFDIVDGTAAPTASFTAAPTTGVAPLATQFNDTSTGVPTQWLWNFGDGTTSTAQSPLHTFSNPGTFSVTLTVTNSKGTATTTQTDFVTVAVNPPLLNAKFIATPTVGAAPLPVQFTDQSVGGVTAWSWDFGDGTTSTDQNPAHTYAASGKYTVKLTVTSPSGTNTRVRTQYVTVNPSPITLTPVADSYVRSNAATNNYGNDPTIQVMNSGNGKNAVTYQPFWRFSVGTLPAAPASAKLRLFTTDAGTTGSLYRSASATWTETGITWNNKPGTSGGSLGASRAATLNQWVEFDVTPTVTAAGEYGFTLTNASSDLTAFSSRQGANPPQLILTFGGTGTGSIPLPSTPGIRLSRSFTAAPFSGTSVLAHDLEGSAYVPSDNALWLSDDNSDRVYEVDATTSILRRSIPRDDFANALPPGGIGTPAGPTRSDDFESLAYDATNDVLYEFSGNCCGTAPFDPAVYRLLRDVDGKFQVESYQALPEGTDPTGAGWRAGVGLFFAHGATVTSYNYATNTLGTPTTVLVNGGITGLTYTPDGKYAIVVTTTERLELLDAATFAPITGWNFDLTPFGIIDARAVELIDGQLFVSDGYDFRPPGDPLQYAVFVFDIVESPPTAGFTATPTSGPGPLAVQFNDTSVGSVTTRTWDFGDGSPTSSAASPAHTYSTIGSYTATLTVGNASGSSSTTKVITVVPAPVTTTAVADTYVRSDQSNTNFGTATTLQGYRKGNTRYEPVFRFSVGALPTTPVHAKVRLFVTTASNSTGQLYRNATSNWSETAVTWNNKPATTGSALTGSQSATSGQWVEFDVSSTVTASGEYSFTLTNGGNLVGFSSRQGANAPQLVISFN